jgi:hypothetical protein
MLLFIDGLNYTTSFFPIRKEWVSPNVALKKIKTFVTSLQRDGWTLEVFLDAAIQSEEAQQKWISRREQEVTKSKRLVPQGANVMLGEMFRHCGVRVHYSLDADNDDTIMAHAVARNASVLSGDKDMYRYIYTGKRVTIYPSFHNNRGRIFLDPPKPTEFKGTKRDILTPPPLTSDLDPSFVRLPTSKRYRRGSPSPLTRYYGNTHVKVKPLRQALYSKIGITEGVLEVFPEWDEAEQKVRWLTETVLPDATFVHLLQAENMQVTFSTFFTAHDVTMATSVRHTPALWHNHVYAMWATLTELISMASREPMFSLLLKCPLFAPQQPPTEFPRFSRDSSHHARKPRGPNSETQSNSFSSRREGEKTGRRLDSAMQNLKI